MTSQSKTKTVTQDQFTKNIEDLIIWFRDKNISPIEACLTMRFAVAMIVDMLKEGEGDNAPAKDKLH